MTRAADLAKLIAGGGTITVDDNSDTLTLESTDADANVGPVLNLHRNSASPADNDLAGRIVFKADDDAGNAATFARIEATATDVSNGGEDGRLDFFTAKDDAFNADLSLLGNKVGINTTSPDAQLVIARSSGSSDIAKINLDSDSIDFFTAGKTFNLGTTDGTVIRFFQNNAEAMRIDTDKFLLIGTTSDGGVGHTFKNTGQHRLKMSGTSAFQIVQFSNDNGQIGTIVLSGTSTSFNTSSDYRLKENVVTEWDATTRLKQLKPSRFNFKTDKDTTLDGFLAHEVSSIVPEAISGEKDAVDKDGNPEYQGIDQSKLVPLLTKSLQEALARIDTLEAEVAKLKG